MPAPPTDGLVSLEIKQYGNAYLAVTGSAAAPVDLGTYLRRLPSVLPAVAVVDHVCVVGPGAVLGVQATVGSATGSKRSIFVGTPGVNECLVEPLDDGTQQITFRSGDAVTECAVYLLAVPAAMIAALDADATPQE